MLFAVHQIPRLLCAFQRETFEVCRSVDRRTKVFLRDVVHRDPERHFDIDVAVRQPLGQSLCFHVVQ